MNLHFVREKNARRRINTALFDKIEYDQRGKAFDAAKKARMDAA